jgi:beta-glucosidase
MFDPSERVPYAQIPISTNDSDPHRALSLEASRRSLVLLENRGVLPLKTVRRLAVIGPTADNQDVLVGNYNGTPSRPVTILAGLREAALRRGIHLVQAQGSGVLEGSPAQREEAVATARSADTVVLVVGLTPKQEGEEGESASNPSGDKLDIRLPAAQEQLIEAILATRKPVVLVVTGGSNLASRLFKKAAATLMAWYPGGEGGIAVAETLFGDYNPAGRLPLTFYADLKDLPDFSDYRMTNRTYRYFTGTPLWPFGHGKSYTTFVYTGLTSSSSTMTTGQGVDISVVVQNTGLRDGEEVVQVYVTDEKASVSVPLRSLVAFQRVALKAGEKQTIRFALPGRAFSVVNEEGQRIVEPGKYTLAVGGGQPDKGGRYTKGTGATLRLEAKGNMALMK